jgi:hypothetical protein
LLRLEPAALHDVGVEDVGRGREQARALLDGQSAEETAVVRDRLEQLGCLAQLRRDLVVRRLRIPVFRC